MSDNEIKGIPPADKFIADDRGLLAWSPTWESIRVSRNPATGNPILLIGRNSTDVYSRELTPAEAGHLAHLLTKPEGAD
jgi:hypothetical protein